jgi:carbon monoxide dehydrogenase subunit G
MKSKFESKIGKIQNSSESVYHFLSNFNNFKNLLPSDKAKNWQSTEDTCSFSVDGVGEVGLRIIEKQPNTLIKITGKEGSKFDFFFWIQLKEAVPYDTRFKLTLKVTMNPFLKMMASKPLQTFIDTLANQLEKMSFV